MTALINAFFSFMLFYDQATPIPADYFMIWTPNSRSWAQVLTSKTTNGREGAKKRDIVLQVSRHKRIHTSGGKLGLFYGLG